MLTTNGLPTKPLLQVNTPPVQLAVTDAVIVTLPPLHKLPKAVILVTTGVMPVTMIWLVAIHPPQFAFTT